MCGIIAYIGPREAIDILINGLKRLEYRGYDSAGVAYIDKNGDIQIIKKQGKVKELQKHLNTYPTNVNIGIGHTRWATHGAPSDINAHPHFSQTKNLAIIHNGIIENYSVLKEVLIKQGHSFISETDTE